MWLAVCSETARVTDDVRKSIAILGPTWASGEEGAAAVDAKGGARL